MVMISFVIPTLEEEKVLAKLLRNLREINTFPYEIIVSDGHSTYRSVEIAKQLADRVVEYNEAKRQTIGQGRNMGAAVAAGEYLVFLDADVYIPQPNKFFSRALEHFNTDPQLVGLGGWLKVFPEMETLGDKIGYGILTNRFFSFQNNIMKSGANCGEFNMIKAEVFRQLRGYDETLFADEDCELFRRLSKVGHTKTDSKLVVYHTGRRAHVVGWPKLLLTWCLDGIFVSLFHRSRSKEWKVIR